jgi:hypothetical protein
MTRGRLVALVLLLVASPPAAQYFGKNKVRYDVFDARTGALVFQEPFKDTQEREERSFDEFTGMFANLYALENRLIGVFVPRTVKSKRLLFTP